MIYFSKGLQVTNTVIQNAIIMHYVSWKDYVNYQDIITVYSSIWSFLGFDLFLNVYDSIQSKNLMQTVFKKSII